MVCTEVVVLNKNKYNYTEISRTLHREGNVPPSLGNTNDGINTRDLQDAICDFGMTNRDLNLNV